LLGLFQAAPGTPVRPTVGATKISSLPIWTIVRILDPGFFDLQSRRWRGTTFGVTMLAKPSTVCPNCNDPIVRRYLRHVNLLHAEPRAWIETGTLYLFLVEQSRMSPFPPADPLTHDRRTRDDPEGYGYARRPLSIELFLDLFKDLAKVSQCDLEQGNADEPEACPTPPHPERSASSRN